MFQHEVSQLPPLILPVVKRLITRFKESCDAIDSIARRVKNCPVPLENELVQVFAGSDFVAEQFISNPKLFVELVDSGDLWRIYDTDEYAEMLARLASSELAEQEFDAALRHVRRREIIRIIWRDLCNFSELPEVTGDMSRLADAMIQHSLDFYYQQYCQKLGTPYSCAGDQQNLVVIGMGKLGAFELNLSSDVDLMFCFPESGSTKGGEREHDNQTFFIRLGQRLIKSLSDTTCDGFVFRVDMRLRPYGQSGALAWSFDAMESYYESQGREWERYALIKARIVAGDLKLGEQLMTRLRPFVFRRYVDFGVIESLREMKALINREVRRKGYEENVKTGSGGIREVEFIAQVFQLMRGGLEPSLQDRRLRKILRRLNEMQLLPPNASTELMNAYVFLRDVEHRIQAMEDRQTQRLPMDELGQARLAFSMNFDGWDFFDVELQEHRRNVRRHFEQIIAPPDSAIENQSAKESAEVKLWKEFWLELVDLDQSSEIQREAGTVDSENLAIGLQGAGFSNGDDVIKCIGKLRQSRSIRYMQEVSRYRLDKLMPVLLSLLSLEKESLRTLERVLPIVEAIARRSAYIALLLENPEASKRLVKLCAASPWVAEQLAAHPILLDELLDSRTLYQPLVLTQLRVDLQQCILRIPTDDLEQQMEALRHFKKAQVFKVAAAEIVGHLPLMKVSDYLTWIAEALLNCVFQMAWEQMIEKHGCPMKDKQTPCDPDFIIAAYGKMGGIELGYGSDLDVVFVHNASINLSTNGERSIDNVVFFARLAQRIIHLLSANTPAGKLYEVDMRLRPSGSSGLLVSSLSAFEKYQTSKAWTWEHQALVRVRVVVGCDGLKQRFEAVRHEILANTRDEKVLRAEVAEMREKMRTHMSSYEECMLFDLKQSVGGVVDIEFIVQYSVLRWAYKHQNLVTYTDNVRILEELSNSELLPKAEADQLTQAYIAYRAVMHRLVLQNQKAQLDLQGFEQTPFCEHRENVRTIWDRLFSQN